MARAGFERRWHIVKAPTVVAATNWALKAPGGTWWRITSITARFVAAAAVANRVITLRANDQTSTWYAQEASRAVTSGETVDVCAHTGGGNTAAGAVTLGLALPAEGLLLPPGYQLVVVTTNMDAADQWSNVIAQVDEIPSDDPYISTVGAPEPVDVGA